MKIFVSFCFLVLSALPLMADETALFLETGQLSNAALEQRAVALGKTLRCVVCANQSIESSDVELAQSLRKRVRERLAQGMSEKQIREELIGSYGEYISYSPSFGGLGILLWFTPWLLLFSGIALLLISHVRHRKSGDE